MAYHKITNNIGNKAVRTGQIGEITKLAKDHKEKLPKGCYVMDLDNIEYAIINNAIVYVAIIEFTKIPLNLSNISCKKYLKSIEKRYFGPNCGQGMVVLDLAQRMGVDAYIAAHEDFEKYFLFCLTKREGWLSLDRNDYFKWLKNKHDQRRKHFSNNS